MTKYFSTLVLDSEGLSGWVSRDRKISARILRLQELGADMAISAATIIEVTHARADMARLNWLLSGIKVEPLTEQASRAAAKLLRNANLHGHKYAIDAMVAEVALRQPGPVALLTSDTDDMRKLCGSGVHLVNV
ncbi:PIN domain-containing protein [Streptomyces sp. ISL-99]|uniref:PIN domain-containing protein n=1 Tax=Streptomyces sp. ISL-99 TaxID=2819193 RepID=UPI001BEB05BF|nr:PIN domain-containing protein [Streptomyces sp. ISL-99]MBT2528428.1 PIN domain-containing protein [Streptomyces sp. ISL-99]